MDNEHEEKTTVEQLAEAVTKCETLQASIESGQAQIADLTAQVESLTSERDEAMTKASEQEARAIEAEGSLANEKAIHAKTAETLDMARLALKSPGYADAARKALAVGTEEGGTPPSTQGDEPKTSEEAHRMHDALTDPQARAEFRETHKELLGL